MAFRFLIDGDTNQNTAPELRSRGHEAIAVVVSAEASVVTDALDGSWSVSEFETGVFEDFAHLPPRNARYLCGLPLVDLPECVQTDSVRRWCRMVLIA